MRQVLKTLRLSALLIFLFAIQPVKVFATLSGTYYIDATNGNDFATGKTGANAWKSFDKVNSNVLSAGTKILLKRGEVWNQRLEIRGCGTAQEWICVDAYGLGDLKPKISLKNQKNDIAILICDLDKTTGKAKTQNISYIQIRDVELANTRMGIYYRSIMGTTNTGFRVEKVIFNNINCDEVMMACNADTDKEVKNAEIGKQLGVAKGNLQTPKGNADGGRKEYIFPAAIFIGGKTYPNQQVNGFHTTILTEFEVSDCQFNETIAGIMSTFYWPFNGGDGDNVWRQLIHKVKVTNCTGTGIVNGMIAFDGINGGAAPDENGVMQPDANGWGGLKNVSVKMGAKVPGRTWPNGTTGVIFSNTQNFLVDSCEFSDLLNQGNPDGCGFDFETNNHQITIQNTKFFNNDGHAILLMNGGVFGGNSNIIIQKNLFANNMKSSNSDYEMFFSRTEDGHRNVKVSNNIAFLRTTNKESKAIGFLNPTRTYVSASDNKVYYLNDSAQAVEVRFLGKNYTFQALDN